MTVVLDPVDGSTNASRGIPYWSTSLCAVDGDGPLAALVVNQATGVTTTAIRGGGGRDGRRWSRPRSNGWRKRWSSCPAARPAGSRGGSSGRWGRRR